MADRRRPDSEVSRKAVGRLWHAALVEPVTHRSERYGWAGWVHWENSGAHFYAWDTPLLFFSVDIYTCSEFDVERACEFTRTFFQAPQAVAMLF